MTKLTRKVTATGAATALVVSGVTLTTLTPWIAYGATGACVAPTADVTVFAFNDFHGRIVAEGRTGLDYLAGKLFTPVEQARAVDGEDNVALISVGDNIGASTYVSMSADDQPTLDILNAIDLEASAAGNHEFDKGWSDLSGRVAPASNFPYLAANVYEAGTTTVAAPMQEYTILQKAGLDIAVVGAVTGDLPSLVSPAGISSLTIGDPVAAINRVTGELLDGNPANGEADVVIASIHEGAGDGTLTAAENAAASTNFDSIYSDIDSRVAGVFNGHTHQSYVYSSTSGQPIVQSNSYAGELSTLTLSVDAVNKGVCSAIGGHTAPASAPDETFPRIAEVNSIATNAYNVAEVTGAQVVGETSAAISTPNDGSSNTRNYESPMTNLVAQMFYEVLSGGDADFIGMQNPGGTRDSFNAGDVTLKEAALTLPFANSLFTTQITGAQFKTVLEQQWQRLLPTADYPEGQIPSRPYLALGLSKNVSYTYDESRAEGDRITSISINGAPIDPEKYYTVGSGSFLISGGDNFRELGNGINTMDTGRADLEAWTTWIGEQDILSPDYTVRGVSVTQQSSGAWMDLTVGMPLEGGVAPQTLDMFLGEGDKVSPQLHNTTLTAYVGDVEVGSAEVVDGVAHLKVKKTLPSVGRLSSGSVLSLVAEESGTEILLPIDSNRPAKKVK